MPLGTAHLLLWLGGLAAFSLGAALAWGLVWRHTRALAAQLAHLRATQAALQLQNRELEAFSQTVSHDLRAPLRRIRSYSELLQRAAGGQLPQKAAHFLNAITHSAVRADGLVEGLLELARLGHRPLAPRSVPLGQLVAELCQELSTEASARQVKWEVGTLPDVHGDPLLLRQALQQLLANALKYTRPRTWAHIEVGVERESNEWILHVRDNGVGFDMSQAHALFSPFARLHPESQFEGHGVGLASVKRIAERHGGRAWAEASPDAGATFFLSLPVHQRTGRAA